MGRAVHAFVAGHPVGHSRSPLIHGHWLAELGIDGRYEALDIAPRRFAAFIAGLPGSRWAGGNVTIPHKEAAFAAVAMADRAAEAIGAVNTVWREGGRYVGGNTDAYGFSANLDRQTPGWRDGDRALVIGAGGASRAVLHALLGAGYGRIDLANRTVDRARALADRFGAAVRPAPLDAVTPLAAGTDLIVNTTALGMAGQPALTLDFNGVKDGAIAADIVYVPLRTPFLAAAGARGLRTADGLGMLLHQAVPGFERWFGARPAVTDALHRLVVADLERHAAGDGGRA